MPFNHAWNGEVVVPVREITFATKETNQTAALMLIQRRDGSEIVVPAGEVTQEFAVEAHVLHADGTID